MSRLKQFGRRIAPTQRRVGALPKVADRFYTSKEWRSLVARLKRERGAFCERCGAGGKGVRLIGDHKREIKDGGAKLDPANIEIMCSACHSVKTANAKAERVGSRMPMGGVKSLKRPAAVNHRYCHSEIFLVSDDNFEVDLFGDRVRRAKEGRGRPEFEWTLERSNKVLLAFARQLSQKEAAIGIGCSVPTLRKVFFRECEMRKSARLRLELRQLERLNREAEGGSVAAEKALAEMLDKQRQRDHAAKIVKERSAKPSKPEPMGVKAQRDAAASSVRGVFQPREGPATVQ
ncbi:MAG: HNH endonuclease signature motif containing protein [Pseudomonadota bacterium]